MKIEDYGLIGDTQTAALVGRDGSIDWLCMPRFDSGACFAGLLGGDEFGCWRIAPAEPVLETHRRYRDGTLVLETEFSTATGRVRLVDCMPPRQRDADVVRVVEGITGRVRMRMQLILRFDYGSVVPWVRRVDDRLLAMAGPDAVSLWSGVETRGENLHTVAEFDVVPGKRIPFVLAWHPSHEEPKERDPDAWSAVEDTERWWREWSSRSKYRGEWQDAVERSAITLKALTFGPTGGIVAAPTTSLPEQPGGVRNWDYRFCWLRDATFTLHSLLLAGYREEACAWRDWLLRAVAGDPSRLQILYGVRGERRIEELEVPWLPGYEGATPVRIGNAASTQFQLDVYGEVVDAMHEARAEGIDSEPQPWAIQRAILEFLESAWREPDEGIWEVRGPRRHFTHSKIMAWLAFDRGIKAVERFGMDGPADRWREQARLLREEILAKGFNEKKNAFVQEYDCECLDAALLMTPLVGFLPVEDPRVQGTIRAIERELMEDGFVMRYAPADSPPVDGLPAGEAAFLPCTFWLADNYALAGQMDRAREIFERVLAVRNDLGLLAEEYHPKLRRQLGNFPQAFSHVGVINTAHYLTPGHCAVHRRAEECRT